jgi:AcrR family transcriptional regulator
MALSFGVQSDCITAVILQKMPEAVKPDRRAARRAETEARLVDAATELFVERGYAATTLADVADRAGLAARTVYLRFTTKAELLRRCIGTAIAGDAAPIPLAERDWMAATMTATTLGDRIEQMAAVTARLMDRTGALLDVARQAAATEPVIAAAVQAGRDDTRRTLHEFWRRAADDGLLPAEADLGWLSETATLLAQADTYLLLRATTDWDVDVYERWLADTWHRLVRASHEAVSTSGRGGT